MSDDDDTGHPHLKAVQKEAKKPITMKLWVVVAIAVVAFGLGAWLV